MPRQARLDYPGCLHHVINRGMERRRIFEDGRDFINFRDALERFVSEDGLRCYGWALLPNHFHLVVRTGRVPLSTFMSRLQTSYAGVFNRRHGRVGRLFQNRFKSIVCDEENFFKEVVAYVHLNPLRAKLVRTMKELRGYRWSGHRAVLGLEKAPWQDVGSVLERFGKTAGEARRRYARYLEDKSGEAEVAGAGVFRLDGGLSIARASEGGDFDTRVLGDENFLQRVAKEVGRIVRPLDIKKDVAGLIREVARREGLPVEEIVTPGKTTARGSRARALVSCLAVRFMGVRKNAVAEKLQVTPLAVTRLCRVGEGLVGDGGEKLLREMGLIA